MKYGSLRYINSDATSNLSKEKLVLVSIIIIFIRLEFNFFMLKCYPIPFSGFSSEALTCNNVARITVKAAVKVNKSTHLAVL